ncbi:MAG: hypothetical protein ACRDTJ_05915 [Pseudonocardiaceae bacterium]
MPVQVLGGRANQAETPMQLPVREGERMVLMLSEGDKEGVFVPYLGSAFVVKGSRVELGKHAVEILAAPEGAATKSDISLEDVRSAVAQAERRQSDEEGSGPQEPTPIREMPTGYEGAGQPGAPDNEPGSE